MNIVALTGRLARDPELRMVGEKGTPLALFTLAVDREDGSNKADFISCKLIGKRAEKFAEHNKKGREVEIRGRLQTWLEEDEEGVRDRYIVKVDLYRSKAKPKNQSETAEESNKEG